MYGECAAFFRCTAECLSYSILYSIERGSRSDTDVPDVLCLLLFFIWPPEGDMHQYILREKPLVSSLKNKYRKNNTFR